MPWKSFSTPESGREYAALLSYLPLSTFGAMPRFLRFVIVGAPEQIQDH